LFLLWESAILFTPALLAVGLTVFGRMLQAVADQLPDMIVVELVVNNFALPAVADHPQVSQDPKLVGHRGFGKGADHGQVADAQLGMQQGRDDFQAGGFSQGLENGGDVIDDRRLRKTRERIFDLVFVDAFVLA